MMQAEASAKFLIEKHLGPLPVPKRIRQIDEVPRFENGVPNRKFCQEMVLARVAGKRAT